MKTQITSTDMQTEHPRHPLGSTANVLLTSVFGPFAVDDKHGSRAANPMELYHNQVTKAQGGFSLRMFHRSWGIMLIQANIEAPCTVLDFPSRERFIEEITTKPYDIVGITAIQPNVEKVVEMCRLIRIYLPQTTILVGGHVSGLSHLNQLVDADYVVRGEGVRWMRAFLSEDVDRPIHHPAILSGFGARAFGIDVRGKKGDVAATLLPSVGCPMGCNFCATSAMFGGKGKFVHFYETGDQLFDVMCDLERRLEVRSFFVMDENFLLYRKRALRLLDLMEQHDKAWALYVFSSANVLCTYTMEQLVGLGISWAWMGLEGEGANYKKLAGVDTQELVRNLREHGIRVLGSTIIGLEEHSPTNIEEVIDYAVAHDTEFHQFMLYTPVAGTPLYEEHLEKGTLLDRKTRPEADRHGQYRFSHVHPAIPPGEEQIFLQRAFELDFHINGPSIVRVARTLMLGLKRYKHHPNLRIRRRILWEARDLPVGLAGALWAARRWFRSTPSLREKIASVLGDVYREFGLKARLAAPTVGRYMLHRLKAEERRLRRGWTYEPPTFYDPAPDASAS